MPWRIYIFHFRCYYKMHQSVPTECWWDTIDVEQENYDLALKDARKEFKRKYPYLSNIDDEQIQVMDWEHG